MNLPRLSRYQQMRYENVPVSRRALLNYAVRFGTTAYRLDLAHAYSVQTLAYVADRFRNNRRQALNRFFGWSARDHLKKQAAGKINLVEALRQKSVMISDEGTINYMFSIYNASVADVNDERALVANVIAPTGRIGGASFCAGGEYSGKYSIPFMYWKIDGVPLPKGMPWGAKVVQMIIDAAERYESGTLKSKGINGGSRWFGATAGIDIDGATKMRDSRVHSHLQDNYELIEARGPGLFRLQGCPYWDPDSQGADAGLEGNAWMLEQASTEDQHGWREWPAPDGDA